MSVDYLEFVQNHFEKTPEWEYVKNKAQAILIALNRQSFQEELKIANSPGKSSHLIQEIVFKATKGLGFQSEKKGLFQGFILRPDFYHLFEETGIIIEVERGKTTINNRPLA